MKKVMAVVLSTALCLLAGCSGGASNSALAKDIEAHSNFKNVNVVKVLQKHPDRSGAIVGTTYVVEAQVAEFQFGNSQIVKTIRLAVFVAKGDPNDVSVSQM